MDVLRVLNPTLYSNAMSLPALGVFAYLYRSQRFGSFARLNLLTQLSVFIPMVQIPALLTGRLSYVDLAWPSGLLAMGFLGLVRALRRIFLHSNNKDGSKNKPVGFTAGNVRAVVVSLAYCFQGGRMALGAWTMFFAGHLRKEMQRYRYQRIRWAAHGIVEGSLAEKIEVQKEAFTQCLANLGPLSVPMALQSCVDPGPMTLADAVGWALWAASFVFEHTADLQKLAFGLNMKRQGLRKQVCNVGLWRHSRHPNYFGEWMVWVALAIASLPALQKLVGTDKEGKQESTVSRVCAILSLLSVPTSMYICLVHWTGAIPAEHYSVKSRPAYADYIKQVNRFFPSLGLLVKRQ